MNDGNPLDSEISRLVRSLELEIPAGRDDRIRAAAAGSLPPAGKRRWRFWILALPTCAAVLLAAAVLLLPSRKPPLRSADAPVMTEIRTDFEIAEKNIRIVFFQRPDFKFFEEK